MNGATGDASRGAGREVPNDRAAQVGSLGAGGESAAALHAAQDEASSAEGRSDARSGTPGAGAGLPDAAAATGRGSEGGTERAGSEPLARDREHKPSYGGEGGVPRTSSDTREPLNPS